MEILSHFFVEVGALPLPEEVENHQLPHSLSPSLYACMFSLGAGEGTSPSHTGGRTLRRGGSAKEVRMPPAASIALGLRLFKPGTTTAMAQGDTLGGCGGGLEGPW